MNTRLGIIKVISAAVAFIIVFTAVQRLLVPKYASYALEGNLIGEYYNSTMDQDVILIGDCEVYANFSTISLWEDYGITSFIRGSPQQLVWHSYYLLEDTIRHARKKPKVVVFNVMAMQYPAPDPNSEPYNRLTIDGMRMSMTKINAYKTSRLPDESLLSYFFPLLRFKENWKELDSDDIRYYFRSPQVSINGFMVRSDVLPVEFVPSPILRANYDFGEKPMHYLEKMTQLAKEHDIELVLIKAPVLFPHWFDEWDRQIAEFAGKNNLLYINFINNIDDIGIDWNKHTFNAGLHLNVFGAELMSRYFGEILSGRFNLPDRRTEPDVAAKWNIKKAQYQKLLETQREEIRETGKISSFLIN